MKKVLYFVLFTVGVSACSHQGFEQEMTYSTPKRNPEWFSDSTGRYHNEQEFRTYWTTKLDSSANVEYVDWDKK